MKTLDVRTIDEPPFSTIDAELESLAPGDDLLLISEFEPQPLYAVLDQRGFKFESEQLDDGEWHVRIQLPEDN